MNISIAIMQPYFFPYIGYFQMVGNSDVFLVYDTVSYIQRGWINRNKIKIKDESKYITVPVNKSKLGTPIDKIEINDYLSWKKQFLSTIEVAYSRAPHYREVKKLLNDTVNEKEFRLISDLSLTSIKNVLNFLGLNVSIKLASSIPVSFNTREQRLDYYLAYFDASAIILPPGSKDLYKDWTPKNAKKRILELPTISYDQGNNNFIDHLSIIDVLMFCTKAQVNAMIANATYTK
jgi:WbqC-like protein family